MFYSTIYQFYYMRCSENGAFLKTKMVNNHMNFDLTNKLYLVGTSANILDI